MFFHQGFIRLRYKVQGTSKDRHSDRNNGILGNIVQSFLQLAIDKECSRTNQAFASEHNRPEMQST